MLVLMFVLVVVLVVMVVVAIVLCCRCLLLRTYARGLAASMNRCATGDVTTGQVEAMPATLLAPLHWWPGSSDHGAWKLSRFGSQISVLFPNSWAIA